MDRRGFIESVFGFVLSPKVIDWFKLKQRIFKFYNGFETKEIPYDVLLERLRVMGEEIDITYNKRNVPAWAKWCSPSYLDILNHSLAEFRKVFEIPHKMVNCAQNRVYWVGEWEDIKDDPLIGLDKFEVLKIVERFFHSCDFEIQQMTKEILKEKDEA